MKRDWARVGVGALRPLDVSRDEGGWRWRRTAFSCRSGARESATAHPHDAFMPRTRNIVFLVKVFKHPRRVKGRSLRERGEMMVSGWGRREGEEEEAPNEMHGPPHKGWAE